MTTFFTKLLLGIRFYYLTYLCFRHMCASLYFSFQDEESKKSSFSLYSGVSDIISGSCSSPSSNSSTPSHSSNKAATTPSPGLQNLSGLVNKSGGGGLLVHHPVTPKKRVVTKTKTDHLSDELNLGYRQVLGDIEVFLEGGWVGNDKDKL